MFTNGNTMNKLNIVISVQYCKKRISNYFIVSLRYRERRTLLVYFSRFYLLFRNNMNLKERERERETVTNDTHRCVNVSHADSQIGPEFGHV